MTDPTTDYRCPVCGEINTLFDASFKINKKRGIACGECCEYTSLDDWKAEIMAYEVETKHQDTTTTEGWENVVAHKLAGGEVEERWKDAEWAKTIAHPSNWDINFTYRIKPVREPQAGDVWVDGVGYKYLLIDSIDGLFKCLNYDHTTVSHIFDTYSIKTMTYLGTIDLSLLMGDDK